MIAMNAKSEAVLLAESHDLGHAFSHEWVSGQSNLLDILPNTLWELGELGRVRASASGEMLCESLECRCIYDHCHGIVKIQKWPHSSGWAISDQSWYPQHCAKAEYFNPRCKILAVARDRYCRSHLMTPQLTKYFKRLIDGKDVLGGKKGEVETIYTLASTRDPLHIRYVGKTCRPFYRLHEHYSWSKRSPHYLAKWIYEEVCHGYEVSMDVVESFRRSKRQRRRTVMLQVVRDEIDTIRRLAKEGHELLNIQYNDVR